MSVSLGYSQNTNKLTTFLKTYLPPAPTVNFLDNGCGTIRGLRQEINLAIGMSWSERRTWRGIALERNGVWF